MVRTYKRKTSRCDISQDSILAAAKAVIEGGKSIRSQAESVGVSPMTLCRYIKKIKENGYENIKVGYDNKQQVFTSEQEAILVKYIVTASKIYFGLSPGEVRVLAYECAKGFGLRMPATWEANKSAGPDCDGIKLYPHAYQRQLACPELLASIVTTLTCSFRNLKQ